MTIPDGYPTHAQVLQEVEILLEQARRHGAVIDEPAARAYAAQSLADAEWTVHELCRRIGVAYAARRKVNA